ncbi:MAG: helix-turn-helix domain-containing protein [Candidatus Moranbacteria bacterium]|nr:helix-turn-helix domain-containing protein [Candidatus Moranbacteria bacterium]
MDNELKKLGLTPNEIKIYDALLEIGENTVGPIIKKVGIHRQVAYDALDGLENKKMVVSTTKNNRAYYRIADPKNILDNIRQQEFIAKGLVNEIKQRLAGQKKGQEIRVYEGEKAFRELTMRNDDLQPRNSEYLVVTGAGARFREIMDKSGVFERSNRIRSKKNIKTKLILCHISRQEASALNRANSEIRFLSEGYVSPTAFAIWHDSINLISYGSDIFCVEIKNDDFYKAYLNYFNFLWKIAKK